MLGGLQEGRVTGAEGSIPTKGRRAACPGPEIRTGILERRSLGTLKCGESGLIQGKYLRVRARGPASKAPEGRPA